MPDRQRERGTVLLVNPNPMRPPIAPIGLDYVGQALKEAGYEVRPVDMSLDGEGALREALDRPGPEPLEAVGITWRNIDSALLVDSGADSFSSGNLEYLSEAIREIAAATDAPVVLGGVGFSAAPEGCLEKSGAEWGIIGEGEAALPLLLDALRGEREIESVPNLIHRRGDGGYCRHEAVRIDLVSAPVPTRDIADNARYMEAGGQLGLETKRGCNGVCTYCLEAAEGGASIRLRPPERVAEEVAGLVRRGLRVFHICDSEFNRPRAHAAAVCRALIDAGLGEDIRWYAYLSPRPFDAELAELMARAGCAGIDFGADHTDAVILRGLGRDHRREDVLGAVESARSAGLTVMVDLLLGGPGETPETLGRVIDDLRGSAADVIGSSLGIRAYPGTRLGRSVVRGDYAGDGGLRGRISDNPYLIEPVFYLSTDLGPEPSRLLRERVGGDRRFLFAGGSDESRDYNYESNEVLVEAIKKGHRGAYWDILRRLLFGLEPLEVPS